MELPPEQTNTVLYTILAGVGGALGYIYRHSRAHKKILVGKLVLATLMSMFIGYHMILVYREIGISENLIGAVNGLTAVLGVEFTLYLFERFILSKFGLSYEQRVTEALIASGWTPPDSSRDATLQESKGVERATS